MDHDAMNDHEMDAPIIASDTASVSYRITPDHPAFEGHFPGRPILPGVVQIHLCVTTAKQLTGRPWALSEIRRAKFVHPVLPGDTIVVKMSVKPNDLFDFTLLAPTGDLYAQAQLLLTPQ